MQNTKYDEDVGGRYRRSQVSMDKYRGKQALANVRRAQQTWYSKYHRITLGKSAETAD